MSYDILARQSPVVVDDKRKTNLDLDIHHALLVIQFVVVIGIHLEVVEGKFLLDALLESLSFFQGQ